MHTPLLPVTLSADVSSSHRARPIARAGCVWVCVGMCGYVCMHVCVCVGVGVAEWMWISVYVYVYVYLYECA